MSCGTTSHNPAASALHGPGRVPGADQPCDVDYGEHQHRGRGDEQNPEAEIGHLASFPVRAMDRT